MDTGKRIAELRQSSGLTQSALAEKLFVSRDLVSKWETGRRLPDCRTVQAMAELFSVPADSITDRRAMLADELADALGDEAPELKPEALNGFLAELGERDRAVFVRRYFFFDSPAEIGEKYGIGTGYVRTVLARTRKKLRRRLKEAKK